MADHSPACAVFDHRASHVHESGEVGWVEPGRAAEARRVGHHCPARQPADDASEVRPGGPQAGPQQDRRLVRVTRFPESYTRAVFSDHAGSLHAVVPAARPDKCSSTAGGSRAGGAEDVTACC